MGYSFRYDGSDYGTYVVAAESEEHYLVLIQHALETYASLSNGSADETGMLYTQFSKLLSDKIKNI